MYFKQIFDAEELLYNIRVVGEISGLSVVRNVAYFVLKDENAAMSCVCFETTNFSYSNGDKVILTGTPRYYVKGGKLNFNVQRIEKFGLGDLYQQFLILKARLEAKGYFDQEHKIGLPPTIKRIGVVTSKEGAVIQDIINIRTRRNPYIDIVLYPAKVQGIGAEYEIAKGIKTLDGYDVDAIIVARGGGSLEDLAPFNTEVVADAVYNAKKFIMSAVGHETDYTICDFCSDMRASTPSAAAELLCADINEQKRTYNSLIIRLKPAIQNMYIDKHTQFVGLVKNLIYNFSDLNSRSKSDLKNNLVKFKYLINQFYGDNYNKFFILQNRLSKLNPNEILKLGYSVVKRNDCYITSARSLNISDMITIKFSDGEVKARIEGEEE